MAKKLFLLFSLVFLGLSCNRTEKEKSPASVEKSYNLDGSWVLSTYIDQILDTKSIEPQSRHALTWEAIILLIDKDKMKSYGLIFENESAISQTVDSLITLPNSGNFTLSYDENTDEIKAIDRSQNDTINYVFRRIKESEKSLVKSTQGKSFHESLQQNFYTFFVENIIAGNFRPLSKTQNGVRMKLLANGEITGFKDFDTYGVDNFFGTHHLFTNDAIIFTNSRLPNLENQPSDNWEAYYWKFNNDTLLLTEYLTTDFENYELGKKQFKFIKEK